MRKVRKRNGGRVILLFLMYSLERALTFRFTRKNGVPSINSRSIPVSNESASGSFRIRPGATTLTREFYAGMNSSVLCGTGCWERNGA